MNQPSAPCSPPSTRIPARRSFNPADDAAAQQEPRERHGESKADEPPPQPVQPFPEEDRLEVGEGHPGVHCLELRDPLVFGEFFLPGGVAERRQRPGDGLPLGDRQPRLGEPGDAAEHHHDGDHRGAGEEPEGDGASLAVRPRLESRLDWSRLDWGMGQCGSPAVLAPKLMMMQAVGKGRCRRAAACRTIARARETASDRPRPPSGASVQAQAGAGIAVRPAR